jgi:hypothetical protein
VDSRKSFLIIFFLVTLLACPIFSQVPKAKAEKLRITLNLDLSIRKETNFDFYLGIGERAKKLDELQLETGDFALIPWARVVEVAPGDLGDFIVRSLENAGTLESLVEIILGCRNYIKSIKFVNYSEGIGFVGVVGVKSTLLKPLRFLREYQYVDNLPNLADIKIEINSEYNFQTSEFTLLHFRLVTYELLSYSSIKNDLRLVEFAIFSALGGFIFIIVCTALSIAFWLYSRRYFRGKKFDTPIWVLAWIFYFCAFLPFSSYLFLALCIVGLGVASLRVVGSILYSRPKLPKKEPLKLEEISEKIEKYLK